MSDNINANLMELGAQAELDRIVRHILSEADRAEDRRDYLSLRSLANDLIEGKHK